MVVVQLHGRLPRLGAGWVDRETVRWDVKTVCHWSYLWWSGGHSHV